jgi:hypothetical protein
VKVGIEGGSWGSLDLSGLHLNLLVGRCDCLPVTLHFDRGKQSQLQNQLVSVRCQSVASCPSGRFPD